MASLQSGGSFFSDLLTGSATSLQTASAMHVKARRKRGPDTDGTVAKQKRLKKAVNSIQPEVGPTEFYSISVSLCFSGWLILEFIPGELDGSGAGANYSPRF